MLNHVNETPNPLRKAETQAQFSGLSSQSRLFTQNTINCMVSKPQQSISQSWMLQVQGQITSKANVQGRPVYCLMGGTISAGSHRPERSRVLLRYLSQEHPSQDHRPHEPSTLKCHKLKCKNIGIWNLRGTNIQNFKSK